jgi:hypothetical protein
LVTQHHVQLCGKLFVDVAVWFLITLFIHTAVILTEVGGCREITCF